MCGIAGFIGPIDGEPGGRAFIDATLAAQRPRGPDRTGSHRIPLRDGVAILGHNRLSVIDLSAAADQPMLDHSGRYAVSFNGEIYNYIELKNELKSLGARFRNQSDTEVILESYKHWGIQFLPRLNGMFAFALVDRERQVVLLVRDRFGVKPLFLFVRPQLLAFASSARALALKFSCPPDLGYVARGVTSGVFEDSSSTSSFEGVVSLEPGTARCFVVGSGGITAETWRYYDLRERAAARLEDMLGRSPQSMLDDLDATLKDAVSLRLRADVPVAVSLSSGLDSSLIAAEAARQRGAITGFCYGSPEDADSEGPAVARFAPFAGIKPEFIGLPLERQPVCDAFERALHAQEAPFRSISVIAQHLIFQRVRANGFKVLLGGQGGDEAFLGYRKYALFAVLDAWRCRSPGQLIRAFANLAWMALVESRQARMYWQDRDRLFWKQRSLPALNAPPAFVQLGLANDEHVAERQVRDVLDVSLPTLLRFEDRNSMGNSVESRLPFLDYRVVEYGIAMPLAMKLHRGFGKWCLRQIADDRLPAGISRNRLKRGFDIAQDWISVGLGEHLRQRIADAIPKLGNAVRTPFDPADLFGDQQLRASQRFAEAVAIIWLGDQTIL